MNVMVTFRVNEKVDEKMANKMMTRAEYLNKYSIRRYNLSDEAVRENELRVSDSYELLAA